MRYCFSFFLKHKRKIENIFENGEDYYLLVLCVLDSFKSAYTILENALNVLSGGKTL